MDLLYALVHYPNDPTSSLSVHAHFVAELTDEHICLYSVSSIPGKEKRVYGKQSDNYEVIKKDYRAEGFSMPSFIDCAKMYELSLDASIDLSKLDTRNISSRLRESIEQRIQRMKTAGKHTTYAISAEEFKHDNPEVVVS